VKNIKRHYESWGEFLAYVSRDIPQNNYLNSSKTGESDFCGTPNWEAALELSRTGWLEGQSEANKIASPLFNSVSSMIERVDIVHDVEGAQIDIARFLDGKPECWQRFETSYIDGVGYRVLRFTFNIAASGGISQATITAKGATMAALIQLLEYSGYRVQVDVLWGCGNANRIFIQPSVTVKRPDQPLDLPRLMFAMAHPSMPRRLLFRWAELMPKADQQELGFAYGYPDEIPEADQGDIHIEKSFYPDSQWDNPESARKWVVEQLKKQGVTLRETL